MRDKIETVEENEELCEIGVVSQDTHGHPFGHMWDGGLGVRLP